MTENERLQESYNEEVAFELDRVLEAISWMDGEELSNSLDKIVKFLCEEPDFLLESISEESKDYIVNIAKHILMTN